MGNLKDRVVGKVKAEAGDCVTKPLDVKKYKAKASDDAAKAKALEENTIDELDADPVGED